MRLIDANGLIQQLQEAGLTTEPILEAIRAQKVYATTQKHYPKIGLHGEAYPSRPDRFVGDDGRHDWLRVVGGGKALIYENVQCCETSTSVYRLRPTYIDPDGNGYCTPCTVYEYIQGDEDRPTPEEEHRQLLESLKKIHGMSGKEFREKHGLPPLDDSM